MKVLYWVLAIVGLSLTLYQVAKFFGWGQPGESDSSSSNGGSSSDAPWWAGWAWSAGQEIADNEEDGGLFSSVYDTYDYLVDLWGGYFVDEENGS
jgi:hypothetical protein